MRWQHLVLAALVLASLVGCSGSPSPYSTPLSPPPGLSAATKQSTAAATSHADIRFTEVLPLFNQRIKASSVAQADRRRLNPRPMALPAAAVRGTTGATLEVSALPGDVVFKDLMLESPANLGEVTFTLTPLSRDGIVITPRLVASWFQSGLTTKKRGNGGALTYELLLSSDLTDPDAGQWRKSPQGGWVYHPPDIPLGDALRTRLSAGSPKRLLLRFEIADHVPPGVYRTELNMRRGGPEGNALSALPVEIRVDAGALTRSLDSRYTLALFTAFKLDPTQKRPGAYVNTMRLPGSASQRRALLNTYLDDIRRHGFNGITIRDWNGPELSSTLDMAQALGFRDVMVHATTPVKKTGQSAPFPIVNASVVRQFSERDIEPMFYGFDEVGGNKQLNKQLALNREIHRLGGKSVNAVFWKDMPNAKATIGADRSSCFDIIAHSLGSNGHINMLSALPFEKDQDLCPGSDTQHLVYWHPNVENPTMNRLLMGFWLWASGFDGVIPHGYYFPSHIEKVLKSEDRQRGRSGAASPYDDWSFWVTNEALRHHTAVYPSVDGPVGTLQWEGILSGYTDLKYVVTLEERLARDSTPATTRAEIRALLDEIRRDVLQIRSVYLDDPKSLRYLQKLERWRADIGRLLRQTQVGHSR